MNRSIVHTSALALGDAAALLALRPRWASVATGLAHPAGWLTADADRALAALCVGLLWLAAVWIAVGLVAGVGARLPGAAGRACARCARVVVPRVLVRLVLGSTGLGLLAAPAAQAATLHRWAQASTVRAPAPISLRTGDPVPAPIWPVAPSASTSPTRLPAPVPPTSAHPVQPSSHRSTPAPPRAQARVRGGDSLWLLAGRRLGPRADDGDIAQYWPQLYAANRSVIGDDPALIHPGQVLHLPTPTASTEETTG